MSPASPESSSSSRRLLRETALVGLPVPLFDAAGEFGPPVLPIAPRHHLLLLAYGNPVFCGGPRTLPAVLQYLWLCSPAVRAGDDGRAPGPLARRLRAWRFRLFALRWSRILALRGVPTSRTLTAVDLHASGILLDRPALPLDRETWHRTRGEAPTGPADAPHELVTLEYLCRRHLGYTRAEFWHTPYATTNGLLAHALRRLNAAPDVPHFDPARDRQLGERLRERIRRSRAAQAQPTRN